MEGDPTPEGQGTRVFLDNAGGNGGGEGCCAGTTRHLDRHSNLAMLS